MTDKITSLKTEIKEIETEIEEKHEEIKSIKEQLAEAARQREDEARAYAVAKKDDEDAVALVAQAKTVLEGFYAGLVQVGQAKRQPEIAKAGEAPPPPPTTWEARTAVKRQN